MVKYHNLKESDYNQIKFAQESGLNAREAGRILKRSSATTSRVYRSKSWQDYQDTNHAAAFKRREELKATKLPPVIVTDTGEVRMLKQHTEVKITAITSTVTSYHALSGDYQTKVFGLGDDNKVYYWNVTKGEPQWTLKV